jgi:hypothetical protein
VVSKLDVGRILGSWINPLESHIYPSLYHIARKKDADVAHVLRTTALNISFRRALGMT